MKNNISKFILEVFYTYINMDTTHNSTNLLPKLKQNNIQSYSIINVLQIVYEKLFYTLDDNNITFSFKNGINCDLYGNSEIIIYLLTNYIKEIIPYVFDYNTYSKKLNINIITKKYLFYNEYYGIEINYTISSSFNTSNTTILDNLRKEINEINGFMEINKYIKNYQELNISCNLYIPIRFSITFPEFVSSINKLNSDNYINNLIENEIKEKNSNSYTKYFIDNYLGKLIKIRNSVMTVI